MRRTKQGKPRHKRDVVENKAQAVIPTKELINKVSDLAEPLCAAEGVELICVECQREPHGRTIRLYLDREGGLTLDDCSRVSRQLSDLLDVYLTTDVPYQLEVSSPGPNRPLVKPDDFERFKGKIVKVRTSKPIDNRITQKGELMGIEDGWVILTVNTEKVRVPFDAIEMARLESS
jgi:ribosome maturation factor RimP